ncbi:MAG: hypothetical protein GYB49_09620 [Alphaproteobacteria bacterium]|nr:hypothetical protein [Hyphomonas sp.]MBR9807467.1 hypothetical protein [Alphaproteobacteria bacterium]|tara:strand:+ start:1145 stop:1558 length:414 start_codon:yes stop_codon:yes gene_type:complete
MTVADLINSHESPIIVLACFAQVMFAFFVLVATAEQPVMTPSLPWVKAGHRHWQNILRFLICLGWIGVIFGATLSASGVFMDLTGRSSHMISQAQNDFGVLVSRLSGAVIIPHAAYVSWKFVVLWVQCERKRRRNLE